MKYSVIMQERRGAATIEDAEVVLGGEQMLRLARKAGWLTPKVQGPRLTLFDFDECLACWRRIACEGLDALRAAAAQTPAQSDHASGSA